MKHKTISPRMGRVGGQAVLEGVMMKSGDRCATACRRADGSIAVSRATFVSARKKNRFFALPLVRGVVNFVEMMKLSMNTLNTSAEIMGETDEPETKFERWLREKLHIDLTAVVSVIGIILGLLLSVGLFIYLPRFLSDLILPHAAPGWKALLEGGFKVLLFVGYLALVSLMRDMRRVFAYHGAEHKSVACYEAGDELTPENAKKHTRFHPRCGTSFMFVMILIGILFSVFINLLFPGLSGLRFGNLLYTLIKLLILPLVVGIGFEFIMYAGKHDNFLVRILSAPGLWMQRLTTREPDETMLECAITALKCAMPDEFPDFDEKTYDRSPKPAPAENTEDGDGDTAADDPSADTSASVTDTAAPDEGKTDGAGTSAADMARTVGETPAATAEEAADTAADGTDGSPVTGDPADITDAPAYEVTADTAEVPDDEKNTSVETPGDASPADTAVPTDPAAVPSADETL